MVIRLFRYVKRLLSVFTPNGQQRGQFRGSSEGETSQEFDKRIIKRKDLVDILEEALISLGGEGKIVQICEYIWNKYQGDLLASGDIFYTWQYDLRMTAKETLKARGKIATLKNGTTSIWKLVTKP